MYCKDCHQWWEECTCDDEPQEEGASAVDADVRPRKRLTDEQIYDLLPIWQNGWSQNDYCLWLARAVERAHGID